MNRWLLPEGTGEEQMADYEKISTMLTTGRVARLFGVHAGTVIRWSERGIIKAYRIGPRGDRRYRREDVAALFFEKVIRRHSAGRQAPPPGRA